MAVLEALGILEHTDIAKRNAGDEKAWHLFAQASRLAYADRDKYEGDPAFVPVPVNGLLAPDYLAKRAALIGETRNPLPMASPPGAARGRGQHAGPGGTSHMVIVDANGNAVSMTTTVESIFGNGRWVDGSSSTTSSPTSPMRPPMMTGRPPPMPLRRASGRVRPWRPPSFWTRRAGLWPPRARRGNAIMGYVLKTLVAIWIGR
jgi:gamma-glutamyltranspeptidase/glutathione hydrolase